MRFPALPRRATLAVTLASLAAALAASPGAAFKTRVKVPPGVYVGEDIHGAILADALKPAGFQTTSVEEINRGAASQDNLVSDKFTKSPQNHCDDNLFLVGRDYHRKRFEDSLLFVSEAVKDPKSRDAALYRIGEGMHTLQDFYSHSNYLETLLKTGKPLKPVDWEALTAPVETPQGRTGIRTGYFHWDGGWHGYYDNEATSGRPDCMAKVTASHPGKKFHWRSDALWQRHSTKTPPTLANALTYAVAPGDFMHFEINKDNSAQYQGRVVSPAHGKNLHQLARDLARMDTVEQWDRIEQKICEQEGGQSAWIVPALKGAKYPELRIDAKPAATVKRAAVLRGTVDVNISNADRQVFEKLVKLGKQPRLTVSALLTPGDVRAEKMLPYDGAGKVTFSLEQDLPLKTKDDATRDLELQVTASLEQDPVNKPATATATVTVADLERSIVFLVDTSGSMAGSKILAAKKAIKDLVQRAVARNEETEWAILSFGNHNVVEVEEFTRNGSRIIESAERGLAVGGDTPLKFGEAKALKYLVDNGKAPQGLLVIMCDGDDNCIGPLHAKMQPTAQDTAAAAAANQKLLTRLKALTLPNREGQPK